MHSIWTAGLGALGQLRRRERQPVIATKIGKDPQLSMSEDEGHSHAATTVRLPRASGSPSMPNVTFLASVLCSTFMV